MKYATRINSFLRTDSNIFHAFQKIGEIDGVDYVDLNYPEHFSHSNVETINYDVHKFLLKHIMYYVNNLIEDINIFTFTYFKN